MRKTLINTLLVALLAVTLYSCNKSESEKAKFITIDGMDLISPSGEKFFMRGTNLGNWLNPEGYMFGFQKTNSPRFINEMFCQLVGPEFTKEFWKQYKDNYITYYDVRFIKSTGANTIRLPFHYKLFTDEDYMGMSVAQDGFERIDTLIEWCRKEGLYLILDMHDAPGGQTGDNIDDSYGYPWLYECEASQQLFCDIWREIAQRYSDEPVILGYELINEPIAHFFKNKDELNAKLQDVYKRAVSAIREVDNNHIIILGGAQWNSIFSPFDDWTFDDKIIYSCHRYGGEPTASAIGSFIEFRDKTNLPMFMGEIGHNTYEWISDFVVAMEENNIGWLFWPYKKMARRENPTSFVSIGDPEHWNLIKEFSEKPRGSYQEIRDARPSPDSVRQAMNEFIELCKFENNTINVGYIEAMGLSVNQ